MSLYKDIGIATKKERAKRKFAKDLFACKILDLNKRCGRFCKAELKLGELEGAGRATGKKFEKIAKRLESEKKDLLEEAHSVSGLKNGLRIADAGEFKPRNAENRYGIAVIPMAIGIVGASMVLLLPREASDAVSDILHKTSLLVNQLSNSGMTVLEMAAQGFELGALTAIVVGIVNKLQKRRAKKIDVAIRNVDRFIIENSS